MSCVGVTHSDPIGALARARACTYFIFEADGDGQEANDLLRCAPCKRIGRIIRVDGQCASWRARKNPRDVPFLESLKMGLFYATAAVA